MPVRLSADIPLGLLSCRYGLFTLLLSCMFRKQGKTVAGIYSGNCKYLIYNKRRLDLPAPYFVFRYSLTLETSLLQHALAAVLIASGLTWSLADQKLSSDSLEKSIKFCSPAGDFSTLFIAILVSIFPNNESKLPDYTTVNSNFCFDVALKSTDQHGNGAVPGIIYSVCPSFTCIPFRQHCRFILSNRHNSV